MNEKYPQRDYVIINNGKVVMLPHNCGKAWLPLYYAMPETLVSKWPKAMQLPRCPYDVLRSDQYDDIVNDPYFSLLIWDAYAWAAWQYFQVKIKGRYRDIPGSIYDFSPKFPLWKLSYGIIPYIRIEMARIGYGLQHLYNMHRGTDIPWKEHQDFGMLVQDLTEAIVAKLGWQPVIDAAWQSLTIEDFSPKWSKAKLNFIRTWDHTRSWDIVSYDALEERRSRDLYDIPTQHEYERDILTREQIDAFIANLLDSKDRQIFALRQQGYTEQAIADAMGYKTASAVHKRIARLAKAYSAYVDHEYDKYLR